jgi:hypothetical protein
LRLADLDRLVRKELSTSRVLELKSPLRQLMDLG